MPGTIAPILLRCLAPLLRFCSDAWHHCSDFAPMSGTIAPMPGTIAFRLCTIAPNVDCSDVWHHCFLSSIIGRYKFSKMYGISVHIAASLVLARRGLRFSERPPAKNARWIAEHRHRHVWALWRLFVNAVSNREKRVGLRPRRAPPAGDSTSGTCSASHS